MNSPGEDNVLEAVVLLLAEEEEEEELLLLANQENNNKEVNELFCSRITEGAFALTVQRLIIDDEEKFREYFRLSKELFQTVLQYIKDDIAKEVYNRRQHPISPEEKLSICLR